jgi:hypothetical protein
MIFFAKNSSYLYYETTTSSSFDLVRHYYKRILYHLQIYYKKNVMFSIIHLCFYIGFTDVR